MNPRSSARCHVGPFVLLVALLLPAVAPARSPDRAVAVVGGHALTNLAPKVPGLSVAVGSDRKVKWSQSFGFADLEMRNPVTSKTLFRVGSLAKPMTAAGLMLLVEKRRVDLDADIRTYLPAFPEKGATITPRWLAGHLAGIRHYQGDEFLLNKPFASVREGLKIFENDPLLAKPGERYAYSSYGYNLLSAVMEVAARRDYLTYMERSVFRPLKMRQTLPDRAGATVPDRSQFYELKDGGGFEIAPTVDNSYKWAGGGFLSTPEDLVRFGLAMLRPGFLKSSSLKTMFTAQATLDGKPTGYGIGWNIREDQGRRVYLHTGGSVGGTSVLMLFPETGVVVAMASNCSKSPFGKAWVDSIVDELAGPVDLR